MQCAGQQPNQTGCWFSLPKTRDDGQALPNFFPPTTTESSDFYNHITLPNNRQAFVPKTKQRFN